MLRRAGYPLLHKCLPKVSYNFRQSILTIHPSGASILPI